MDVYLVGIGMTQFGRLYEKSVKDIAAGAVGAALALFGCRAVRGRQCCR